jgi:CheY-like chemotaxis protein
MSEKPVVLIAEDDRLVRNLLRITLRNDYELRFAEDGLQTVEQAKEGFLDLILMDINMPKVNGWQAIRELRALQNNTPIVVITGFPDPLNEIKAKRWRVFACLNKPIDLIYLQEVVRKAIEPRALD